jgi:hypothetical protein
LIISGRVEAHGHISALVVVEEKGAPLKDPLRIKEWIDVFN